MNTGRQKTRKSFENQSVVNDERPSTSTVPMRTSTSTFLIFITGVP